MKEITNVLFMVYSVLNRKPITDLEARNNYKEVVWDYIQDLESLEYINVLPHSSAFKHQEYLNKLIVLDNRYKSIGNDFLPNSHTDAFLSTLQDMMRDYLDNDIHLEIYKLEHNHYSDLVRNVEPSASTQNYGRLQQLKQMAHKNMIK